MDTANLPGGGDCHDRQSTGRPPHNPTASQRAKVVEMAGLAVPQSKIALTIGISPKTLRRCYRNELEHAAVQVNLRVVATLYEMAVSGHYVAATIFWAKTRCGFRSNLPADYPTDAPLPVPVPPRALPASPAPLPAVPADKTTAPSRTQSPPPPESIVVVGPNGERVT